MEAKLEQDLKELLDIAERLVEENRAPTDEERERFTTLDEHIRGAHPDWRERLADQINRLAAALEGIGI